MTGSARIDFNGTSASASLAATRSTAFSADQADRLDLKIINAAPEILLIAPCGYGAEQAREEYRSLGLPEAWHAMPAVRNGRVYALEANSYFSRPGPRLVTGIEALAKLFHPAIEVSREAERAVLPIPAETRTARAATV